MIGNIVTNDKGIPLDNNGNALSKSAYQPPRELMNLFAKCQVDYGLAWQLQHRPFKEFDGLSLLQRANLDQQTFGAYVGAEYIAPQKRWRWQGRKNTARDKIIGTLAQLVTTILMPTVFATTEDNTPASDEAKVMKILVQEHLRRADYDVKFIFMVLASLVNPATFVQVEYVEKLQRVKVRLASGETTVKEAVDELMSGLALNVVPIDEILLGDFFTFHLQAQPLIVRLRRIPYDVARGIYTGRFYDKIDNFEELPENLKPKVQNGYIDRFDYVRAGTTRIFAATQENQTLYDIEWTEGDRSCVQEATFYYRGEDLQVTWVGGVFMGNYDPANPKEVYNCNPFTHRRMTLVEDSWGSMPVYPFAKSGYEPLDPGMRFAYYKSAAFKMFWDDATLNVAHQLLVDGMKLGVFPPLIIDGITKYDSNVMAPGAVAGIPKDSKATFLNANSNLSAAVQVLEKQNTDMSDSTIASILQGTLGVRQSATAYAAALANAKRMLNVFAGLTADLVRQVGELTIDCIVSNTTVGEVSEQVPGALNMKFQTYLARGKEKNKEVTHKVIFTDRYTGMKITDAQKREREWQLWEMGGGNRKDATKIWEVNPYAFARRRYACHVDVEEMIERSTGADQMKKDKALSVLTSPAVAPFTDQETVVNDFAIEEYGGDDPDRYKKKGGTPQNMMQLMGMDRPVGGGAPGAPETVPAPTVDAAQRAGLVTTP